MQKLIRKIVSKDSHNKQESLKNTFLKHQERLSSQALSCFNPAYFLASELFIEFSKKMKYAKFKRVHMLS